MVYETKLPRQHSSSTVTEDYSEDSEVTVMMINAAVCINGLHLDIFFITYNRKS